MTAPTAPVAPTTATLMSPTPAEGRRTHSCGEFSERLLGPDRVGPGELEGAVQRAHGVGHALAGDHARDPDRRRRDHLDVDVVLAERAEDLRRHAGMGLHARADD